MPYIDYLADKNDDILKKKYSPEDTLTILMKKREAMYTRLMGCIQSGHCDKLHEFMKLENQIIELYRHMEYMTGYGACLALYEKSTDID